MYVYQLTGNSSGVTLPVPFPLYNKYCTKDAPSKQPEAISCESVLGFQTSARVWAGDGSGEVEAVCSMRATVCSNLRRAHTLGGGLVKGGRPARMKGNLRYHFQ